MSPYSVAILCMKLRHSTLSLHFSLNYVTVLCRYTFHEITSPYSVATQFMKLRPHNLHEIRSRYSVAILYMKLPSVAVRAVNTPASYFGGPAFIFRSGYRLSCRVSRDFSQSHCNAFLMRARPAASTSFTSHYSTVILPSSYPECAEPYLRTLVHHHDLLIESFPDISQSLTPCHVTSLFQLFAVCMLCVMKT